MGAGDVDEAPALIGRRPTPNVFHSPSPSLADGPPISASETTSFIDERAASSLPPPNPSFLPQRGSVGSSFGPTEPVSDNTYPSDSLNPLDPFLGGSTYVQDKPEPNSEDTPVQTHSTRRSRLLLALVVCIILIVVAIALGVHFGNSPRKKSVNNATSGHASSGSSPASAAASAAASASLASASASASAPTSTSVVFGGDGTVVTTDQGTTFTYVNKFGGYFAQDSENPFNNAARAQSWVPPLNQSWEWGTDQVLGVNLGGWLVLEPFITPAIYEKYPTAIDEWTLHTAMAADPASGGLNQLDDHYNTFITEEDFAQIAGAGLSWVRLPIPFWAIDTWVGEPFLPRVCWKYALKAFAWARKYGIRILLDIHSTPGSQNGYNHSGQSGKINVLNGVMGIANAQRLLHYIRIFTEFISQPEYKDVILMLGVVNEPLAPIEPLSNFYIEAHRIIRNITGVGAGNGPFISIQGGSPDLPGFQGSDRIALEQHPYFAFDGKGSADVVPYITAPCSSWANMMNSSQQSFGVTTAAEWSLGFNDCGFMLHSTADEHTTSPEICDVWNHWENYTTTMKSNVLSFAMSNMDALQQWFFWTWKIGPTPADNSPRSPLWSYQLGLNNGWIPQNPRDAYGHCASLGISLDIPFDGTFLPYQTGGGSGVIDSADLATFGAWPPTSIGLVPDATLLPTYTATGSVPTLPMPSFPTPTPTDTGDGWYQTADTASGIVTVAGCSYPNAWDATAVPVPTTLCPGG